MVGLVSVAAAGSFGCSSGGSTDLAVSARGLDAAEASVGEVEREERGTDWRVRSRPAALVGEERIDWSDLWSPLVEAAGGLVLEELTLDILLEREARSSGIALTKADVERERAALMSNLTDAGRSASSAGTLLMEVRRARGLGPARFESLLRRTALLRALVADEVRVDEAALREAFAIEHGKRHVIRLITTGTLTEASGAAARVRAGESFGAVAAEVSTDQSAARGGIIEPISLADPSYPPAILSAVNAMQEGDVSPPVAIDGGYAVLLLERIVPAEDVSFEEAREDLEARARSRRERVLMDRLASRLLRAADITILDTELGRAWSWRRAAEGQR